MLHPAEGLHAHLRVLGVETGQLKGHVGGQALHGLDVFALVVSVAHKALHLVGMARMARALRVAEADDVVIATAQKFPNDMRADISVSSGDNDFHNTTS